MERYKEKIPLDTCVVKSIVKSIENADYLYQNYLQEEKFPTDNGSEGAIWKKEDIKLRCCIVDRGNFWEYMTG